MSKLQWDEYFLGIAFLIAQRSIDESTKCGCVITSQDHRVLSVGYNGPLQNIDDSIVPQTRPEKYLWFVHAEANAIYSYNGPHSDINGATAYVTGIPCDKCLTGLLQKGIKRIVVSNINLAVMTESDSMVDACAKMLKQKNVDFEFVDYQKILNVLNETCAYIHNYIAKQRPIANEELQAKYQGER